jgi:hypothetical protein
VNAADAVRRRKRAQRVYTSAIAALSTCSLAYAIDMNAQADKGQAAAVRAGELQKYSTVLDRHIAATEKQYGDLLAQYNKVLASAKVQQTRMLADLAKVRDDVQKARNVKLAPVVYAVQSVAGGASVSAASGGGASSGTS